MEKNGGVKGVVRCHSRAAVPYARVSQAQRAHTRLRSARACPSAPLPPPRASLPPPRRALARAARGAARVATTAAMAQLNAYLAEAATAVARQDGAALAALLAVDAPRPLAAVSEALRAHTQLDVGALASARLPPPYDEVRVTLTSRRACAGCRGWRRRGCA
jgi:hypothetical protein